MRTPRELQQLFSQGVNISQLLRGERSLGQNTSDIIEVAYELQSGSYVADMSIAENAHHKQQYSDTLAEVILSLCTPTSILEAGVGEATILSGVLKKLGMIPHYGFDISWSRLAFARQWLQSQGQKNSILCTGDLKQIPFADNSIDVVFTSHAIEPNGGYESEILQELFRVTRRYLVLLEPGYEFASAEGQKRMESHGYCRNLPAIARNLGYEVLINEPFTLSINPDNPTAITVIRKTVSTELPSHVLACPRFKTPLEKVDGMLFSSEALATYPVLGGIPCLRTENAIASAFFKEMMTTGTPSGSIR